MANEMPKAMSEAQRAYEAKRAAKAGVPLEKWMKQKAKAAAQAAPPEARPAKRGLVGRLFGRK
jgi:hypothetical protein